MASAALFYSGNHYAQRALNALNNAQDASRDAHRQLNAAHEDKENMAIYATQYGNLLSRKIIGEELRLDWIESLEQLRKRNLVTSFTYNIAPQKTYSPQPPIANGNFDIRYSEMKLNFDLLHEGQLLNFFNALRLQDTGWYQLEGCTLQRNESTDAMTQSPLKAECIGGWVTLKNRNATP
jgi:hypothetical protein